MLILRRTGVCVVLAMAFGSAAQAQAIETQDEAGAAAASAEAPIDPAMVDEVSADPLPAIQDIAPEPSATSASAQAAVSAAVMPKAESALVLDFAESDSRAIAVGERGHILISESRSDWRQVGSVPSRVTLTAVDAVGNRAVAVGHDGTILLSTDGGLNWRLVRSDPWAPLAEDSFDSDPRQGAPLLDVRLLDDQRGFALGAYALLLKTEDGGENWQPVRLPGTGEVAVDDGASAEDPDVASINDSEPGSVENAEPADDWTFAAEDLLLEEEANPHLNAMAITSDGSLLIAGERGSIFRSVDGGKSWERRALPYAGSMFGALGFDGKRVVVFGLRGNIWESTNLGESWQALPIDSQLSLMGGERIGEHGFVLVGVNGLVVTRPPGATEIKTSLFTDRESGTPVLAAVLPRSASSFVVAGEKGVGQYQLAP